MPSGTPQPPQPPAPSGPLQPPTVNINGQWEGTYRHDSAAGTMKFFFFDQSDKSSVDGQFDLVGEPEGERVGAIAGTLSGNELTFSYGYGMNCVRTISGTATVASANFLSNTLTGTFSGSSSCGDKYTGGRFSLPIQRPRPGPLVGSQWRAQTNIFGAGSNSTWQITTLTPTTEGFAVTGSVTLDAGESTGPLSGILLYVGYGDPGGSSSLIHRWRFQSLTVTLSGRCPSTLTGRSTDSQRYFGAQVTQLFIVLNGSTCSQSVDNVQTTLVRQ